MKPKNHKNCRCLVVHLAMPFVHHPRAAEKHGKSRGKAAGKQRSGRAAAAQSEKYQEKPLQSMAFVSLPKEGGVYIEME